MYADDADGDGVCKIRCGCENEGGDNDQEKAGCFCRKPCAHGTSSQRIVTESMRMRRPPSGGLLLRRRLLAVQEIGGALRMGGCAEDGPLVVFQNREPVRDIGSVILAGR